MNEFSRRSILTGAVTAFAGGSLTQATIAATAPGDLSPGETADSPVAPLRRDRFIMGLNTSTIRGQKLSITEEIELAAKAGYQGMEPWIDELKQYADAGGSLEDLGKRFQDAGISVESAIGFFDWIVDDDARRRKGLEDARRAMELVRRIGGKRLAAPPAGATDRPILDLIKVADRYRELLMLGDQIGVVPQVEVWGFSKTLGRLGEAAFVAIESSHPKACILPDVYHLYRGGSAPGGITLLSPSAIHVFHFNDYPAHPSREQVTDADRIYPGDGVAPLKSLLRDLSVGGFRVMLSLELFNRKYWSQDPLTVIKTGLAKMESLFS